MTTTKAKSNTTEETLIEENEENLFNRSSRVLRSPVGQIVQPQRSMVERELAPARVVTVEPTSHQTDFHKLGEQIRQLVEMLEDGKRRSIHQPMRDAIESIRALFELSAIQLHDEKAKEVIRNHNSTQTSPWLRAVQEPKKRHGLNDETPDPKRKHKLQEKESVKPKVKEAATGAMTPANRGNMSKGTDKPKKKKPEEGGWSIATSKKIAKKKLESKKNKPDAIIIEASEGLSYAEILRNVKANPKLEEVGKAVSRIRRTQKGELLIQLKETGDKTAEFKNAINDALGRGANVRTLTSRTIIELKDVDEVTEKQDIYEAIKSQFGVEVPMADILSLRNAYGGTQTATINLSEANAKKLLEARKIKIGWVVCRIRKRTFLTKCFKCLEFGHIAKQCKNGEDRSKLCRKCGTEGHIAKNCDKEPSCMFCRKEHPNDAKHVAGSSKCPVYRRANTSRKP